MSQLCHGMTSPKITDPQYPNHAKTSRQVPPSHYGLAPAGLPDGPDVPGGSRWPRVSGACTGAQAASSARGVVALLLKRAWEVLSGESMVMWGGAQRGTTAACFPYYYSHGRGASARQPEKSLASWLAAFASCGWQRRLSSAAEVAPALLSLLLGRFSL